MVPASTESRVRSVLASALLLLFFSNCCCPSIALPVTSTIDVPARLEELQQRHDPPEVVVTVKTVKPPVGNHPCGPSPVCLLLAPVVLFELATRKVLHEVTVTRDGAMELEGVYDEDGKLVSARIIEPEGHQLVSLLSLPTLGRDIIVETGRLKRLADGGEESTSTTILSQVPLDAEYKKAFAAADSQRKGALLMEAFRLLRGELDDFVLGELRATTLDEQARTNAISGLCLFSPHHPGLDTFVEAALSQPAPEASRAALNCKNLSSPLRLRAAEGALPAYCAEPHELSFEVTLDALANVTGLELQGLPADCPPERVALLQLAKGLPPQEEVVRRALLSDFYADAAERYVKPKDPVHRAWILSAMHQGRTDELLELLEDAKQGPAASEVEPLLRVAKAQPEDRSGRRMVVRILSLLKKSEDAALMPIIERLVEGELREQALLVLAARGDPNGRHAVAAALVPKQGVPMTSLLLLEKSELAAYVLVQGGCSPEKLEAALKQGTVGVVDKACGP